MTYNELPLGIRNKLCALMYTASNVSSSPIRCEQKWDSLNTRIKLRYLQLVQVEHLRDALLLNNYMSEVINENNN